MLVSSDRVTDISVMAAKTVTLIAQLSQDWAEGNMPSNQSFSNNVHLILDSITIVRSISISKTLY